MFSSLMRRIGPTDRIEKNSKRGDGRGYSEERIQAGRTKAGEVRENLGRAWNGNEKGGASTG